MSIFRTDAIPAWASIVALALGVGPGWRFLWTFRLAEYDPATAVLTATLIALIWTAHYTNRALRDARKREVREGEIRRNARIALLAGVVAELENFDTWAGAVNDGLYLVRIPRVERTMMLEALRNSALLNGQDVAVLATLSVQLTAIDAAVEDLVSRVSQHRADYRNASVADIERMEPEAVRRIRHDIAAVHRTLEFTARTLSPELFQSTKWAKPISSSRESAVPSDAVVVPQPPAS